MLSASCPSSSCVVDRNAGGQVAGPAGQFAHPVVERIGRPDDAAGDDALGQDEQRRPRGG